MTQLYTDADVELAARTLYDAEWRGDEPDWDKLSPNDQESYRKVQRAVLSALAGAGWRKLDIAETRTEHSTGNWNKPIARTHWASPWLPVPAEEDTTRG